MARHTLNTISGDFAGGGETSSTKKRYARSVMHVLQNSLPGKEGRPIVIGFSRQDSEGVPTHENDLMLIKVQIHDWGVKRVLMDSGISTDILYWDAFKGMNIDTSKLLPLKGTLVGFSGGTSSCIGGTCLS